MIYIVDEEMFGMLPPEAQAMIQKDAVSVDDPEKEGEIQEIAMPSEEAAAPDVSEPVAPKASNLAAALAQAKMK